MIRVENLTKRFGAVTAIQDVSFEVEKGQVLGFLGPNAAGKTTTMRVLSGFFPATEGRAWVAGFDVFDESMEARRCVGYLPENPPLYPEMTVSSFLRFAAVIKSVDSPMIPKRLGYVIERCGLEGYENRLIKHLSKGFKQRVGLAQALVHDPDVLILDEPTVGLDPKQIIEVRQLIKSLGGDHTVILSTHILPEVSMTCGQVIIIKDGRIAAKDTPRNLTNQLSGGDVVELDIRSNKMSLTPESLGQMLEAVQGVARVTASNMADGHTQLTVETDGAADIRPALARTVLDSGTELFEMTQTTMTLEQVFLELTTDEPQEMEEVV
jgi:ABC-2 type transport system ATP-binding protein